jgi:hypothetical protein
VACAGGRVNRAGGWPDRMRAPGPPGYRSSVCSTPESPLDRLAWAIDELAADCRDGTAPAQLAERIARVWEMVSDLDPELARRRSRYEGTHERP